VAVVVGAVVGGVVVGEAVVVGSGWVLLGAVEVSVGGIGPDPR